MTAAFAPRRARGHESPIARLAALTLLLAPIGSAQAQFGALLSVQSNEMFRGRSISAGRPTANLALSYDAASGAYAGAAASAVFTPNRGMQPLAVQEYAGFARRIAGSTSFDLGIANTNYSEHWSGARAAGYTEAYAGIASARLSARVHFSPNYLRAGWRAVYVGVDYLIASTDRWAVGVHGGALLWVAGGRPPGARFAHYDWEVSAARRIGRFQLRAGWAQGGPQADYYGGNARHRGSPILSLAAGF